MFQLTEYSPERPELGHFYLVTQSGEHGPYETYDDAIDAALDEVFPGPLVSDPDAALAVGRSLGGQGVDRRPDRARPTRASTEFDRDRGPPAAGPSRCR